MRTVPLLSYEAYRLNLKIENNNHLIIIHRVENINILSLK